MKTLLLALILNSFLTSSNNAMAYKPFTLDQAASAIIWMKFSSDLPVVKTSETSDLITFNILNESYSISREGNQFRFSNFNHENLLIDSITIEKIFPFYGASTRALAVLADDDFNSSIIKGEAPSGYQNSQSFYQCSSDLPIKRKNGKGMPILKHTWMQYGASESFGMPFTDNATYMGGKAHIRSPDSFIKRGPKHLYCSPAWIPDNEDEQKISKKIACIAKRLSISQNPILDQSENIPNWVPHFDYHAMKRNCLMATRFVLNCAGAIAPHVVNAGIGGKFNWNDTYSVSESSNEFQTEVSLLRAKLTFFREQKSLVNFLENVEMLIARANELDQEFKGDLGVSTPKTLREICELAKLECIH